MHCYYDLHEILSLFSGKRSLAPTVQMVQLPRLCPEALCCPHFSRQMDTHALQKSIKAKLIIYGEKHKES